MAGIGMTHSFDPFTYQGDDFQYTDNWTWPGEDRDNFGIAALHEQAMRVARAAGAAVYSGLMYIGKYAAPRNSFHEFYTAPAGHRPGDYLEDAELAEAAIPVPLKHYRAAERGERISDTDAAACFRYTQFQKHWATMVRSEFSGYWGTRAEQLCAARWLRTQLEAIHVRKSHIAAAIPMILALARLPSDDEQAAAEFAESDEYVGATVGHSWPKRLWRFVWGKPTVAKRKTVYIPTK